MVVVIILALLVRQSESSLLYTYLSSQPVCTFPEHIRPLGKEDRYMIHYHFMEDHPVLDGKVTLQIRTKTSWLAPVILRELDPRHSSLTVDLVTGENYRFCFEYEGTRSRVPFEFEIGRANANSLVDAHEDMIDTYMDLVQSIEVGVAQVADEVETLMTRQEAFEGTVRSAYTRVVAFTLISFVVVGCAAAWQLLTLKTFFRAKKIV